MLTGAGYIGAALLRRLDASAGPVVALENFFSSPRACVEAALPSGTRLVEGDVADPKAVSRAFDQLGRADDIVVYHLAAQASAAIANKDPELTERSNLVGARIVLESAKERHARVAFGGSFRVYGDDFAANQCVDERTPYGRVGDLSHLSKAYVEQLARMIGLPFASVRLGVTYGLSPIMKATPAFMTVPNLFCQRASHGDVLNVLEDRAMAFIHVEDAAAALLYAAAQPGEGWQVYNAAPEVATIGQVARVVQGLMEQRGRSARIAGATTEGPGFQVCSRLELEPRHTLQTGLGDVLDYFLKLQLKLKLALRLAQQ